MSARMYLIALGVLVEENPDVAKKINGVIAWHVGDQKWVADLKEGRVYEGTHPKPGVTLTMAEKDFVSLFDGTGNAQSLFMSGKIKMKGNMGLVMKLQQLTKLSEGGISAKVLFAVLGDIIAQNPDLIKKINGIYQWVINDTKKGGSEKWVVDVKNAPGSVYAGDVKQGKAGVTLTIKESDFVSLMTGQANAQSLFMGGKIKLKGNMGLAMKLGQLQSMAPQAKL